jgi:hypothetical protein
MGLRDIEERREALSNCLDSCEGLSSIQINDLLNGETPAHRIIPNTRLIFRNKVHISICQYSLGFELGDIQVSVLDAIDWYEKLDPEKCRPKSREGYVTQLQLISLCILLGIEEGAWEKVLNKWRSFGVEDRMVDQLIISRDPACNIAKTCLFEKQYLAAAEIFNAPEEKRLSALSKYTKGWYKHCRSFSWYNGHEQKGPAYFGYWCLEGAAIAKIMNISLEGTKIGHYFPYGFFGLPEQF